MFKLDFSLCHVQLTFFYVMFGLDPDISLMDPRVTLRLPEDDRRKNNTVIAGLVFLFVIAGLDPAIQGFPGQTVE